MTPGFHWCFGSVFFVHCAHGPRGSAASITIRFGRYYHIFRFRCVLDDVSACRYFLFPLLLVECYLIHGIIYSGRYLEAYSKARTADAISALGFLRPTEALLLSTASSDSPSPSSYSNKEDLEKGDSDLEGDVKSTNPGFKVEKIDASLLEVGDIVRIQSGATPPADATIVSGTDRAFDESSLTGESRLIKKALGDKVFLGTINKGGMVDARVDAIGGATM